MTGRNRLPGTCGYRRADVTKRSRGFHTICNTTGKNPHEPAPFQLRDFLIGSRAAWQDINAKGGVRGHAVQHVTIATMGVQEIGPVYAADQEQRLYRDDLRRIAGALKLKLQSFRGQGELARLGQQLTAQTPAILLFIGGTPELVQFTQGLQKQSRQRYVVALADVNLPTMMQMGVARNTPVIATQPVPMVTASLPIVRAYRETLARLFDEQPTPLSLPGFIAARYTFQVLSDIDGALTRQSVLAAFQRRSSLDVGGYRVAFGPGRARPSACSA